MSTQELTPLVRQNGELCLWYVHDPYKPESLTVLGPHTAHEQLTEKALPGFLAEWLSTHDAIIEDVEEAFRSGVENHIRLSRQAALLQALGGDDEPESGEWYD